MTDRPGLHPKYRMSGAGDPADTRLCGTGNGRTHSHWCRPGKHYWRCPGWLRDCTFSWTACPDHDVDKEGE